MIQLVTKNNANRISDFGFFPAVAGHADAWILALLRSVSAGSLSFAGFLGSSPAFAGHAFWPPVADLA